MYGIENKTFKNIRRKNIVQFYIFQVLFLVEFLYFLEN